MTYLEIVSICLLLAQLFLIENTTEKPDIYEDNEVDLCQFTTLGGVYHLDILELPPQCKPVKGWMIVQVSKFFNINISKIVAYAFTSFQIISTSNKL